MEPIEGLKLRKKVPLGNGTEIQVPVMVSFDVNGIQP